MSDGLKIATLGSLSITDRGEPVRGLVSRKAEAMLVYLACTRRPHERALLADLLWDDASAARSRNNLSVLLTSLRQQLSPYLTIARQTVAFNTAASHWVDTIDLEAQVRAAQREAHQDDKPGASSASALSESTAARLEQALALYQGDFLEGFSLREGARFEAWMSAEQERLRRLALEAGELVVRSHLERGAYGSGIAQANNLLRLDPLHEDLHREIMLLLTYSGQRRAALAHYEGVRRTLDAELGMPPDVETTTLYEQIRNGDLMPPTVVPISLQERAPTQAPDASSALDRNRPDDAAPYPSMDDPLHNLPIQRSPLLGREQELSAVRALLGRDEVGLVTLTGMGGSGKTRLALQVAADLVDGFSDGVWLVELAPIRDRQLVASTIAQTLQIKETAGQPLVTTLQSYLLRKRLLLVLDNFEQVLDAAPLVAELLSRAPGLKVLATSRAALRLADEHEYPVPPLRAPNPRELPPLDQLPGFAAAALFIQRARAGKPDFEVAESNAQAIAEICARLDGLPLAIELAAARIKLLPPQAMLARLNNRLALLTGGVRDHPARHATLRSAIDWSYDLLNSADRQLFRRLGVFVNGCTADAAATVCSEDGPDATLDALQSLIDKSLLRQAEGPDGEPYFVMLETIREYALMRLGEMEEAEALRRRHTDYYVALAEDATRQLGGPRQVMWLDRLEREHENMRAALAWSLASDSDVARSLGLRLVAALWWFWHLHGHVTEGRDWIERMLVRGDATTTRERAQALLGAGWLAKQQEDDVQATARCEEALALFDALDDRAGAGWTLDVLGRIARAQGEDMRSAALYEQSLALFRASGDGRGIAWALSSVGLARLYAGHYASATVAYEESIARFRGVGDTGGLANALRYFAAVLVEEGKYDQARQVYHESLGLLSALGDKRCYGYTLNMLGELARLQGDFAQAKALYHESLALSRTQELAWHVATVLHNLGWIAEHEGDVDQATELFKQSLALAQREDERWLVAASVAALARIAAARAQWEHSAELLASADALLERISRRLDAPDQVEYDRTVALVRANLDAGTFAQAWSQGRALTPEQVVAVVHEPPAPVRNERAAIGHAVPSKPAAASPGGLTAREVEVLCLVAAGLTDAQVAERLILSPRTVSTYLTSVYGKLQVSSRSGATRWAVEQGLI